MHSLLRDFDSHNPNSHTESDVRRALQGVTGTRRFSFNYELLDASLVSLGPIEGVLACTVSQSWFADIKRTAKFLIRELGEIDFLSNRIRPWVRLHLPPYGDNDYVEFPQGTFLLSSPKRSSSRAGLVTREVEGFDGLQIWNDDAVSTRYSLAAGTNIVTAVKAFLGATADVPAHSGVLVAAKEWDPGTSKLRIINDLLQMINYNTLAYGTMGYPFTTAYVSPSLRGEEYVYADDTTSTFLPDMEQELDIFRIPNKWTRVVSEPDQPVLTSTYTNANPASLTSTIRRGRTILDFQLEEEAVTQAVLDDKVARIAFESSQLYEQVPFETGLMPIHSGNDVFHLRYANLAIDAKYSEVSWEMPLALDATMTHQIRRVVSL